MTFWRANVDLSMDGIYQQKHHLFVEGSYFNLPIFPKSQKIFRMWSSSQFFPEILGLAATSNLCFSRLYGLLPPTGGLSEEAEGVA